MDDVWEAICRLIVASGVGVGAGMGELAKVSGVSTALGKIGDSIGNAAAKVVGDVANGALSSALTQGIGVATGLQKQFSWTGVAAAGVGSAIGGIAGRTANSELGWGTGSFGNSAVRTMADATAQAATHSVINGNSFGDNLLDSLPSALGNTIGNLVANGIAVHGRPSDKILDQLGVSRGDLSAEDRAALKAYDREVRSAGREAEGRAELGEFNLSAETSSRLDRSYRAALEASAKTPAARAMVDDYYALVDEQFSSSQLAVGDPGVADGPVISVVADPNQKVFVTSKLLDGGSLALGSTARRVGGALADEIAKRPGLGLAIQAADTAMTIWGGPIRAVGGAIYEHVKGGIQTRLEGAYSSLDYSAVESGDGASGMTIAGSILLSGLGSIKHIGGKINLSGLPSSLSGKQNLHILGDSRYRGGGYFNEIGDAQSVLDAARSGKATVLGRHKDGVVVRYDEVTGYNHNPGAGYSNQATNVFWIKGLKNVSIVPISPSWRPK